MVQSDSLSAEQGLVEGVCISGGGKRLTTEHSALLHLNSLGIK